MYVGAPGPGVRLEKGEDKRSGKDDLLPAVR